ncbi:hypothetical protein TNCT_588841 [Trichonephila clavata]|uniref:Uncharacterized protein n=1 Tax=Trichonephila clavata TaxID=2740835 RepID=A0A8X6KNV9_TRICU|nr:hypothetical protein TNCT_588841 [Trichonephila clavata]
MVNYIQVKKVLKLSFNSCDAVKSSTHGCPDIFEVNRLKLQSMFQNFSATTAIYETMSLELYNEGEGYTQMTLVSLEEVVKVSNLDYFYGLTTEEVSAPYSKGSMRQLPP